MPRKRILWLCSWYPDKMEPFNGDFVQRHANAAALYNDIHVIHAAGDITGTEKTEQVSSKEGLTEHIVYYKKVSGLIGKFINYNRWRAAYRQAIDQYIQKNGKPDLVHVHVPMRAGLFAMRLKKKYGIPYVVTEHWTIYQPQSDVKYAAQKPLFRSVIQWVVKGCSRLLPVSNDLGLRMNEQVAKKEFTVIENVANENYFHYADIIKPGSPFRFIHVSNMTYQKNAEGIIECFADFCQRFPAAELVIAGNVPASIKQLIEETGLLNKKIFLRGEISYTEVAKEMQEANALLMFSRFENSPCSIIEALCCGLPVIATRVGGIPELINETNGMLVESLDKKGLIAAMEEMITNYKAYNRKKIAEDAAGRFSYPVIGKKLDEVYASLI